MDCEQGLQGLSGTDPGELADELYGLAMTPCHQDVNAVSLITLCLAESANAVPACLRIQDHLAPHSQPGSCLCGLRDRVQGLVS